jgi:glutaredoxin-like protein
MTQKPILLDRDKTELKRTFRKDLSGDVKLRLFTQSPSVVVVPGRECKYCAQTQQLLEELAGLSPKLHLETIDFYQQSELAREEGISRIPATVLDVAGSSRVKFYGIPLGHQLVTLVEDIKVVSRGVSPLSTNTRKRLREIKKPVHIQVFVTPEQTPHPGQDRLAHAFAMDCSLVSADAIELHEFPALGRSYGVRAAPMTVVNEYVRLPGPVSEQHLLQRVLEAGGEAPAAASAEG